MLTVKLKDILESAELLKDICGPRGRSLSPRTARNLASVVIPAVARAVDEFNGTRNNWIKEYGHKNAEGVPEVPVEKIEEFSAKVLDYLDSDYDVLHVKRLKAAELEGLAQPLSVAEWAALQWLWVDDDAEA